MAPDGLTLGERLVLQQPEQTCVSGNLADPNVVVTPVLRLAEGIQFRVGNFPQLFGLLCSDWLLFLHVQGQFAKVMKNVKVLQIELRVGEGPPEQPFGLLAILQVVRA
jgi:hypothetical protein